jgi:hypothetical protein
MPRLRGAAVAVFLLLLLFLLFGGIFLGAAVIFVFMKAVC